MKSNFFSKFLKHSIYLKGTYYDTFLQDVKYVSDVHRVNVKF